MSPGTHTREAADSVHGIWIVVVGFNGADDTRQCLISLAALDDGRPSVVYVDNASDGNIADEISAEFPWCHVIKNPRNEGYAGGNNRGIEYALARGASHVVVLNNDTIVAPDFLRTLLAAAAAHPDYGMIGPVIGFINEPSVVMTDGCRFNDRTQNGFFSRQEVPLGAEGAPLRVHETEIVNGCCFMASAGALRKSGLFDERFFLVHEESELCLRMRAAGFRLGVLDRMLVWHKGSSSFKRTGRRLQKYFDVRNLALLMRERAPFNGSRRSSSASWRNWWRYAYHRFCLEIDAGEAAAATAVLEGLTDALYRRTGPYQSRRRPLVRPLRYLFSAARAVMHTSAPLRRAAEKR